MNWLTKRKPETQKNDQILFLHKSLPLFLQKTYLGPSLWYTLFWEPHKPTGLVQTLTVTHLHRMQKDFPEVY